MHLLSRVHWWEAAGGGLPLPEGVGPSAAYKQLRLPVVLPAGRPRAQALEVLCWELGPRGVSWTDGRGAALCPTDSMDLMPRGLTTDLALWY